MQAGNRGFTLLELIVVIFITGIAFSIVFLAVSREYEKAVFKDASKKIFITLKHARETSLMERTPVTFMLDKENRAFWLEKNGSKYGRTHQLPENIKISGESIMFFPKGNASGGAIIINDEKGRKHSIEVDPILGTPKIKGI
ncbi:MAG: prepilin-type N-terminal cleavage/methylation domain-containing protein [Nitrospirae bacterium]|nr:prepilin-type N-terminal cleavage/methylation domain-containing protein [Nitrospirota bacterium]